MKKSQTSVTRALLTSVLAAGAVVFAGSASADPAGLTPGYTGSSDTIFLASTDFKGEHRYTSHVAYERKAPSARLEDKSGKIPVVFKGKPPYKRHTVKYHQLEKVQFARFEEKPGITKSEHRSMYYGGAQRPPYRRN